MSRISSVISTIVFVSVLGVFRLYAQDIAELPDDPRIKSGKLDNGLSYYLVNNPRLQGYADVYLLQSTGTSVENSAQKGITSIITNMGIRSSRNFPGTTMLKYLSAKGVTLNKELEIELNKENCRYKLLNVPVDPTKRLQDSTLLILFNWSCFITFDEEDVEKEKEYVKNTLTQKEDVSLRLEKKYLRKLLKGTSYSPPYFNNELNLITGYSSKEIRSYYFQWFRPDLQAVVVVGDISTEEVETQIKSLFQAAPRGINPRKRVYEKVENNQELEVAVSTDKEATTSKVKFMFKVDVIPNELKETAVPYVMDYMNNMMTYLIRERLMVLSRTTKFPIISYDVKYGKFFGIKEKEALSVEVETSPESVSDVIEFITVEMESIRRNGFLRSEFIRARDVFFDRLNYEYNWRMMIDNKSYADRCMNGFLDGGLLASVELHKEYMEKVKQEMNHTDLNAFVTSYIRQQGINCVITCSYPENCSEYPLSTFQIKRLHQQTIALEPIHYDDEPIVSRLLDKDPIAGTIKHEAVEPITKSVFLNLANGARVVLKNIKNEPEKFRFRAIAKGGLSLYDGDVSGVEPFIDGIASIGGFTRTSSANLERLMMEKEMSLSLAITPGYTDLCGGANSKDLKTFMELVYLNFSSRKEDRKEFDRYKMIKNAQYEFIKNNPEVYFRDTLADKRDLLKELNYVQANEFVEKLYSNAADFTFVIAGDFNETQMREMVLKYIGSLPGNPNKKHTININQGTSDRNRFPKASYFKMEMEFPRYFYSMGIHYQSPFNVENKLMTDLVSWIVGQKVIENMAVEMQVRVDVNSQYKKYPKDVFGMEFNFVTKSFSKSNMPYLKGVLYSISRDGVTETELGVLKTIIREKFLISEKVENSFWTDLILDRFVYGKDLYSKYLVTLEALGVDEVNEALSDFIDNGVVNIKIMGPK